MSTRKEDFLAYLTENEDDEVARLGYSDWLEEHGEPEEAERQRQWTASKKWLVELVGTEQSAAQEEERYISYQALLELGLEAVTEYRNDWLAFHCGDNQTLCDALRENKEKFWRHWSIVTGLPLPEGAIECAHFSCAC